MKQILLSFVLVFLSFFVHARPQFDKKHDNKVLSQILVNGLSRTNRNVVINELDMKIGKKLNKVDFQESFNRLFNLQIFSEIDFKLKKNKDERSTLLISVKERWTLIPIAKVLSGGGSTQFTFGAFDINVLGEFIELGAQYETLNGSPGFVHWFRNPRVFGKRFRLGYDIWNVTRNRLLFSSSVPSGEVAETVGGYTVNRKRYNFFIDKEFIYWFNLGVGLDIIDSSASSSELGDDIISRNQQNGFSIPGELKEHAIYTYFRLGRLNFQNYLVEGFQTDWNFRFASEGLGGNETSHRITQNTRLFFLLPYEQNIGFNLAIGHSNSQKFQNNFFVGGLSNVRGFQDGQFVGTNFWQANAEYRISSFRSRRFVLQNTAFYDVGNVSGTLDKLFVDNPRDPFHSVGLGVRLISPSIFSPASIGFAKPDNSTFISERFMALHIILVRIRPDAPTKRPVTIKMVFPVARPAAEAATPE